MITKHPSFQGRRPGMAAALFGLILPLFTCTMNADTNASPDAAHEKSQLATLGGGCFWCTEAVFERLDGVASVISGYAGGQTKNPTYREVCNGTTGHAEVIQVKYDPDTISYAELLDVFWQAHDPTTLNRQGADTGTQYRSVILYHDEAQKTAAEASKTSAKGMFKRPIVTEIAAYTTFYPAEEAHQDYFKRNPNAPYCVYVIHPKLRKLDKNVEKE